MPPLRRAVCMRPLPARLPACRRRPAPAVERAVRRGVCRRCGARKPPTFVNFSSRAGELASGCTRVKASRGSGPWLGQLVPGAFGYTLLRPVWNEGIPRDKIVRLAAVAGKFVGEPLTALLVPGRLNQRVKMASARTASACPQPLSLCPGSQT